MSALVSTLEAEAHQLWERLVDRHNACFAFGMPLPNTAEIRARYRRLIAKASSRYIRRVVRPAIVRIRPEQVDMAPIDMDQVVESGHVVHVDSLLAINPDDLGSITAGVIDTRSPIHQWFELSYAQYLTIPRSVLQSMPAAWQARFVACLEELDATIDWRPPYGRYWVQLKNNEGRYQGDPLMDYERGRRRIAHRTKDGNQ